MILFLIITAVLWWGGMLLGLSRSVRSCFVGVLYVYALLINLTLPDGHPMREWLGREPEFWLILGGAFIVWFIYRQGLRWLQARADKRISSVQDEPEGPFSEAELNRYARHIVLREVGGLGQKRLKDARVLVVGAGGLGSPALMYLAAAGVGTIGVIDDDAVDASNLQRQIIHTMDDETRPKVASAAESMQAINPHIVVKTYQRRMDEADAVEIVSDYDLVLDGTDNFDTRYLVNRACVAMGKPLVSGALSQWEGQLSVFDPTSGGPCYQCVFPEVPAAGLAPNCAEAGVISPLPGVVGSMMAVEAVKVITGAGEALRGEMLIYDALYGESRKIALKPHLACPVCNSIKR